MSQRLKKSFKSYRNNSLQFQFNKLTAGVCFCRILEVFHKTMLLRLCLMRVNSSRASCQRDFTAFTFLLNRLPPEPIVAVRRLYRTSRETVCGTRGSDRLSAGGFSWDSVPIEYISVGNKLGIH